MKETLLFIDANSLVHRTFHALPPLTTPQGEPSGALYGLSSVLLKLAKEQRPTYIAAFFDRQEPTFRDKLYADYKANRPPTDNKLLPQIKEAPTLLEMFGIRTFSEAGFEADDLIGTFVEHFKKTPDLTIIVLSGDQDLMQLVEDDRIFMQYMRKGITDFTLYNEDAVIKKFGFMPVQLPDYKGLIGDASDNIPGVPGIGPKTASDLLRAHGTLEEIFKNTSKLPPLLQKKFEGREEQALLSKNLATIHRLATISKPRLADLTLRSLDEARLAPYFENLGFQSLVKRLYNTTHTLF